MVSGTVRIIKQTQVRGNVLVVEDRRELRNSIASALDRRGLKVKTTGTGLRALTICKTVPIDIVVLDYQDIGKIDGIEVARRLQKSHPSIKVVSHTAFGNIYLPQAAQLGLHNITDWIYKKPKSIETVINKVFERLSDNLEEQAQKLVQMKPIAPFAGAIHTDVGADTKQRLNTIAKLKQTLDDLKQPNIYNDLQQRQIQLSQFKIEIRDMLWRAFSKATPPHRNLVHMLKASIKHIDINISMDQIGVLDYILDLFNSSELNLGVLSKTKSMLQSVNLDPMLRIGEQLETLKQLYQQTGSDIKEGSEIDD